MASASTTVVWQAFSSFAATSGEKAARRSCFRKTHFVIKAVRPGQGLPPAARHFERHLFFKQYVAVRDFASRGCFACCEGPFLKAGCCAMTCQGFRTFGALGSWGSDRGEMEEQEKEGWADLSSKSNNPTLVGRE